VEVGHLANHILTGIPRIAGKPQTSDQKMVIQMSWGGYEVDINHHFSDAFFEFINVCMDHRSDMKRLIKVSGLSWA
jgi:hypothetical protein